MNNMLKILLALCLLLFIILCIEWQLMSYPEEIEAAPLSTDFSSVVELELPEIKGVDKSIDDYISMVEKPLFIEGRKPLVIDDEESPLEDVSTVDDLTLVGIYSLNQKMIALFSQQGKKAEYSKILEGEGISGWTLKEIQVDKVVLERRGNEQTLMLRKARKKTKQKFKRKGRKNMNTVIQNLVKNNP